jgi:hypothetical protein
MTRVASALMAVVMAACGVGPPSESASAVPAPSYAVSAASTAQGYQLRLHEPGEDPSGAVSVTILDPDGLLVGAAGTWGVDSPDSGGLTTVVNAPSRPDILELYWSGGCADEVVISAEQTADGIGITLDSSPGRAASTCRPRGFAHLLVALALARPTSADDAEVSDLRPGSPGAP